MFEVRQVRHLQLHDGEGGDDQEEAGAPGSGSAGIEQTNSQVLKNTAQFCCKIMLNKELLLKY